LAGLHAAQLALVGVEVACQTALADAGEAAKAPNHRFVFHSKIFCSKKVQLASQRLASLLLMPKVVMLSLASQGLASLLLMLKVVMLN
jgi:hypothetical protein